MNYRNALFSLLLAVTLAGCGGGGGGGDSSSAPAPSNGLIGSTSGTVTWTQIPAGIPLTTTNGRAYSVELTSTLGDTDLTISTQSQLYSGTTIGTSMYSSSVPDVVSFVGSTTSPLYMIVDTWDSSASYTLKAFNNHLAVGGASVSRSTQYAPIYFSFPAIAGQAYNVTVTPTSSDAMLSAYSGVSGYLPDTNTLIGTADNNVGAQAESMVFVASESKTYYFKVTNVNTATLLSFTAKVETTTAAADLQVSINSLTYNYSTGNLAVNYTVSNTGVAYSSAVNLHFWLDSATAPAAGMAGDHQLLISGVAPGATVTSTQTISAGALTSGTLWAYVDPENVLAEADETNNVTVGRPWSAPVAAPQTFDFENALVPIAMTTGGASNWGVAAVGVGPNATGVSNYSLRSGAVAVNQSSCTEIAVTGVETMSFDWKAFADYSDADYLKFYVDGWTQFTYSGADTWQHKSYTAGDVGLHTYKWCYVKGATENSAVDDGGWIDNLVLLPAYPDLTVTLDSVTSNGSNVTINYTVKNNTAAAAAPSTLDLWANSVSAPTVGATGDVQVSIPAIPGNGTYSNSAIVASVATSGTAYAIIDSANAVSEKLENNNVSLARAWTLPLAAPVSYNFEDGLMPAGLLASGNAGWQIDSTTAGGGTYSMRAQTITDSQSSCVAMTVNNSSSISFSWKVSSESSYDYLKFYIDGSLQTGSISGAVAWTAKQYTGLALATHEFKWCYTKDGSASGGTDTGWVDTIVVN